MKKIIRCSVLLLLIALSFGTSSAQVFQAADGLYYKITGKFSVTLVCPFDEDIMDADIDAYYQPHVDIPEQVEYNDALYTVTDIGAFAFAPVAWWSLDPFDVFFELDAERGNNRNTKLESVTIPRTVRSIGDYAFTLCVALKSIKIPEFLTSIGYNAFTGCSALESIVVDSDNLKFDSRNNCNAIIETQTNTILYGCKNTVIPGSVRTIGKEAFMAQVNMRNLTIPNSVRTIGEMAFELCTKLEAISIPNSVSTIGGRAFSRCFNMRSLSLGNSLEKIGYSAFSEDTCLQTVVIPNSVTDIGSEAFADCGSLETVTLPTSLEKISDALFGGYYQNGCYRLKNIEIPATVKSIGRGAFDGCSSLPGITLPDGLTYIGGAAFSGCRSLPSINIPDAVTFIGGAAFNDCVKLESVYINDLAAWCGIEFNEDDYVWDGYHEIHDYQNPLQQAKHLYVKNVEVTDLEIPGSVTEIKHKAFYGFQGVKRVTIPSSVVSIGSEAFDKCGNLTDITIGKSVKSVGYSAFYTPSRVTCLAQQPPTVVPEQDLNFMQPYYDICWNYNAAVLTVPKGTKTLYQSALGWKGFRNIVESDETVTGDITGDNKVDIDDLNLVLNGILNGGAISQYDTNNDGKVDVEDLNIIINAILRK